MSMRKAAVLELATNAYEIDADVKRGLFAKIDGRWTVAGEDLEQWLVRFNGQEVVLIAASLNDERALDPRTCRRCGREYVGMECPHCRAARVRLRGW